MKTIVKKYFEEFAENIDFPTIIYIFETGRVITCNSLAQQIVGKSLTTINKLVREKEIKLEDILNHQGSKIYYNMAYRSEKRGHNEYDMELNAFAFDNTYIVVAFFDYSYKQAFVNHMKSWLPRITWKDTNRNFLGMNASFKDDLNSMIPIHLPIATEEILDTATAGKILEDDRYVMTAKVPQMHMLQLVKAEGAEGYFCSVNRIPLINSNGTVVGLLGSYRLIFNKEEQKNIYNSILKSNNILNQLISRSDTVILSWKKDAKYHLEYISSNISHYGYYTEQFYQGEVRFEDIIEKEDFKKILIAIHDMERDKNHYFTMDLTIRTADKRPVQVRINIGTLKKNSLERYYECMIQKLPTEKNENALANENEIGNFHLALDSWEKEKHQEELSKAIMDRCREFSVCYQPVVRTDNTEVVGVEALLRWKSPFLGEVKPVDFLSMSNYLGLQGELAKFLLKEVAKTYGQLSRKGHGNLNMHINISMMQLFQPDFMKQLITIADNFQVPREHMILEIKESLAIEDIEFMKKLLLELKKEGFSLALDNFGAGFVDVHSIMDMPFDYIKMDKKFMESYGTPKFNGALVAAMLDVIRSMDAQVIAEGVETLKQYEFLLFHEVYAYQGFYYSKPLEKKSLYSLLK